jgi:hypothetical protein
MARRSLILLVVLALGAGCDRARETGPTVRPTDDPAVLPADPATDATSECVNLDEGLVVRYPAGWHVNTGEILGPCALFDPEPIEVPRDSEIPVDIAIMIGFAPVPFETLTGEVLGRRTVARERTTVDGRAAMRIAGETTGEGLHDPGLPSYEYFVDLGDTTMVASTFGAGPLPFDRKRIILDRMMATVDFVPAGFRTGDPH